MSWQSPQGLQSKIYDCGYCGNRVASAFGYSRPPSPANPNPGAIYSCPQCVGPTYFVAGKQIPGVRIGADVGALPPDIKTAYNEARDCMAVSAYTSAALMLRKILMHIAVDRKAANDLTFKGYVDYLVAQHFVPPGGQVWVNHIRDKGNELNHELVFANVTDATELIGFVEMLLKFIYEFPSKVGATVVPAKA
jgi:Domain of unknown function (DUF4145)